MVVRGLILLLLYTSFVFGAQKIIDLTHPLNNAAHRWPTNKEFELTVVANQSNGEGKWYASNDVSFSEHTGTHLDAPVHFALRDGIWYSSTIPVDRLVAPLHVIDLKAKAESNRDYLVTADDITNYENVYGKIKQGTVVIFDFGWAQYWDSYEDVFGSTSTNTTTFHFPGVGIEAAEILHGRGVYGVGVDTPSVDYGPSQDFVVHNYLLEKNIYFLENVADMSELPAGGKGVTLVVGVMKIEGGTGGPARLIALLDDDDGVNSTSELKTTHISVIISSLMFYLFTQVV